MYLPDHKIRKKRVLKAYVCYGYLQLYLLHRMLVNTQYVFCRVTEKRCYFRGILSKGSFYFTTMGNDGVNSGPGIIYHNRNYNSGIRQRFPARYPCSAYLAHTIIKCQASIFTLPDTPAKNFFVK